MNDERLLDSLGRVGDLRRGITTGSCAQAAAKGAAELLLSGRRRSTVSITLPGGTDVEVPIETSVLASVDGEKRGRCTIRKDAGDDDDVTDGALISAEVGFAVGPGVAIRGGVGVGTVTKPGLPVPVGEPAINPVPRRMICHELEAIAPDDRGFTVTLSVADGEELAKKTWNPRVGVVGGISIIGTSGIVEPKSSAAFKSSIAMAIKVSAAQPERPIYVTPGYLGERVLTNRFVVDIGRIVKAGDHIGFALKHTAVQLQHHDRPKQAVLIGHIGKLAKVAAGMFNTHSKYGDARLETVAAVAASVGADRDTVVDILNLKLAEASVALLRNRNLESTFDALAERVYARCLGRIETELDLTVVLLSLEDELLGSFPTPLDESGVPT